ncbi:hypothetical protein JVU11DRAFT_2990 [Chiua virens]|nr:hypothetical protein JVU11DRAFT_2990 [Chiua virens]
MLTPNTPLVGSEPAASVPATREQGGKADEVDVEITGRFHPSDALVKGPRTNSDCGGHARHLDIKASGLPAKVGFFSGLFYVRIKGGKVPQRTKTAKYNEQDEFVARWGDTVKLSGIESSKVEIDVYARRFFFSYKIIKKTESKESLADLLEHSETPIELELLEEGQAAGKLMFKISRSSGGAVETGTSLTTAGTTSDPAPQTDTTSVPETPKLSP